MRQGLVGGAGNPNTSHVFDYVVSELEILEPYAVSQMTEGDWDLTLFTCTPGGQHRVTLRCNRK